MYYLCTFCTLYLIVVLGEKYFIDISSEKCRHIIIHIYEAFNKIRRTTCTVGYGQEKKQLIVEQMYGRLTHTCS